MKIYIMRKNIKQLSRTVEKEPFILNKDPKTVKEFISAVVNECVKTFSERDAFDENMPISDSQWEMMTEMGRFWFGAHDGNTVIDPSDARKIAFEAVDDGLVRIFQGSEELLSLDTPIQVKEGDEFTFVRLTMLAGRLW